MSEAKEGVIPDLDKSKIQEVLSKEGVKEAVKKWYDNFSKQDGVEELCGITVDGLIVGVRDSRSQKPPESTDYFQAWVLDASVPADQIESNTIHTTFSYWSVDRYRDGGTTIFPGAMRKGVLDELKTLSDQDIKNRFPEDPGMVDFVNFFKKTDGFYVPAPHKTDDRPEIGDKIAYPLTQDLLS